MKVLSAVALVATLAVSTEAACNLACNKRGTCGTNDRCTCYHAFNVAGADDCSQRACPVGKSWGKTGTAHEYAECSSRGTCDRSTGLCECNDGFTGNACQRTTCPNKCSGKGECLTLDHVDSNYAGWDAKMVQVCKCDPGYTGNDCSLRTCPKGDDPLSIYDASGAAVTDDVHVVTVDMNVGTLDADDTFTLSFTTTFGEVLTTRAISALEPTATEIKEALESLPNNAIPSCTVLIVGTPDSDGFVFKVTFSDSANSGPQNLLALNTDAHTAAGHQPVYGIDAAHTYTTKTVTRDSGAGTEESVTCAGRGVCDHEKGECQCFKGFTGGACQTQTNHQ